MVEFARSAIALFRGVVSRLYTWIGIAVAFVFYPDGPTLSLLWGKLPESWSTVGQSWLSVVPDLWAWVLLAVLGIAVIDTYHAERTISRPNLAISNMPIASAIEILGWFPFRTQLDDGQKLLDAIAVIRNHAANGRITIWGRRLNQYDKAAPVPSAVESGYWHHRTINPAILVPGHDPGVRKHTLEDFPPGSSVHLPDYVDFHANKAQIYALIGLTPIRNIAYFMKSRIGRLLKPR